MTKSKIEWTERTWNPVRGCTRVSEGCRNCYAERHAARFCGTGGLFEGFATAPPPRWTGRVDLVPHKLDEPLRVRKPSVWFVNSMSDLFHEALPDAAIDRVFAVMAVCPQHTFQVLTKRPERLRAYMVKGVANRIAAAIGAAGYWFTLSDIERIKAMPLPNVWLGVSVEDQATAEARILPLLDTPASVRFVSYEPALGAVDFRKYLDFRYFCLDCGAGMAWDEMGRCYCGAWLVESQPLDWVICGGESGPGARPMHPAWPRQARDQCNAAGVPFFFKQWGEWGLGCRCDKPSVPTHRFDDESGTLMSKFGRQAAGRLLDGREWNQRPAISYGDA